MTDIGHEKALTPFIDRGIALAVAVLLVGAGITACTSPTTAREPGTSAAPDSGSPDPGDQPLDVDLSPGQYVGVSDIGAFRVHGDLSVVVTVTNTGESTTVEPLEVVLRVPTESLHLVNREDDAWDCEADDEGMRCTIPDVVVPEESWPELLVGFVEDTSVAGTLDVTTSGSGTGGASVDFAIDTSL
ncbi:hypothetical protein [Umezawaea sp. Da 62-37]|uniref:hypothetical protein n=1 Tax=Umezawaea sp. Da 62-37 TaxID=3075927 RepID=UPI0028F6E17B|nr:hypothetical protein [Umezawaea sp. Da 62-37]WNV82025.1 hypothetical protein RM788_27835 [Umezawaea sp. Da 62-37]